MPSDVRLEYSGCRWAIKTSQVNAVAKTCDDQVHSSGSSSQNVAAPLPKLDVLRTLAKFPLIDTDGDSITMSVRASVADASCRLLQLDRALCSVWSSISAAEETPWNSLRGNGRYLDFICLRSVRADHLVLAQLFLNTPAAPPTMSSIRSCWMLASIMPCTQPSRKLPMTDPSFCLRNSVSLRSTRLQSRGALSIRITCCGNGLLVGKILLHTDVNSLCL